MHIQEREDVKCHTNERIDVILLPKRTEKVTRDIEKNEKKKERGRVSLAQQREREMKSDRMVEEWNNSDVRVHRDR